MLRINRKVTVIIMTIICIALLIGGLLGCIRKVNIKDIKRFEFSYQTGNAMNASVMYRVTAGDDGIKATVKPNMVAEESAVTHTVTQEFVDELIAVLQKYNVGRWNGFKGNNRHVLDGKSFHLFLTNGDGDELEATGYAKFPSNYREVRDELDALFATLGQ